MPSRVRLLARSALRAAARLLLRAEAALGTPALAAAEERASIRDAMREHDMVDSPDESYYRERYLEVIGKLDLDDAVVLDAGVGSGRMLGPLAQRAKRVVGVDFVEEAIERARGHADGLANVELVHADLVDFLRGEPDESYDVVVFLEAAFVMPHLDEALDHMARILRPGGSLAASFRTRLFVGQLAAATRNWELAEAAVSEDSVRLRGFGYQRWTDAAGLTKALRARDFTDISLCGIGVSSGIEGDPLAGIARPSALDETGLERLGTLEDGLARSYPDAGRYVLAVAHRNPHAS